MEFSGDAVAVRFNRLIDGVLGGSMRGNAFQPWEVEILLDVQRCGLPATGFRRVMLRYRRFANRRLYDGAPLPPMLSEYLTHCRNVRPAKLKK